MCILPNLNKLTVSWAEQQQLTEIKLLKNKALNAQKEGKLK